MLNWQYRNFPSIKKWIASLKFLHYFSISLLISLLIISNFYLFYANILSAFEVVFPVILFVDFVKFKNAITIGIPANIIEIDDGIYFLYNWDRIIPIEEAETVVTDSNSFFGRTIIFRETLC